MWCAALLCCKCCIQYCFTCFFLHVEKLDIPNGALTINSNLYLHMVHHAEIQVSDSIFSESLVEFQLSSVKLDSVW